MAKSRHPVVISAISAKADLIRQVAAELNLSYQEESPPDEVAVTKFVFPPLDEVQTMRLAERVPREAYAYQGVVR